MVPVTMAVPNIKCQACCPLSLSLQYQLQQPDVGPSPLLLWPMGGSTHSCALCRYQLWLGTLQAEQAGPPSWPLTQATELWDFR